MTFEEEIKLLQEKGRFKKAKREFIPRSVGKLKIINELREAIKEGVETDWIETSEYEYCVDTFNVEAALKSVVRILKDKGLLKHLL